MHQGMLVNLMVFYDFGCLFDKISLNSSINDRFYKGLLTAFRPWRKSDLYQGIIRVSSIAIVCHGMLINIMVFNDSECPFAKGAPE